VPVVPHWIATSNPDKPFQAMNTICREIPKHTIKSGFSRADEFVRLPICLQIKPNLRTTFQKRGTRRPTMALATNCG
jgi:hypothetical protein